MAVGFGKFLANDRLGMDFAPTSIRPKAFSASYVAAWAAGAPPAGKNQVAPLVGDLVKVDTTINNGVQQCVASDVPYGMIMSINSGNGILSVLKFTKADQVKLEYSATFVIGNGIQATGHAGLIAIDGVFRDQVKPAGTFGYTVSLDQPTGLIVVEFNGNVQ